MIECNITDAKTNNPNSEARLTSGDMELQSNVEALTFRSKDLANLVHAQLSYVENRVGEINVYQ